MGTGFERAAGTDVAAGVREHFRQVRNYQKGYRILLYCKVETSRDVRFSESADTLLPSSRAHSAVPRVPTNANYAHFPSEIDTVGEHDVETLKAPMGL